MSDFKYEVVENLGVLSINETSGWIKEFNLISWNDNVPKYDIRDWSPDREKMSRGITLNEDEILELKKLIK